MRKTPKAPPPSRAAKSATKSATWPAASPVPNEGRSRTSAGQADVAAQIARFDQPARRELRKLAGQLPRFAELTATFPAAAYAIATRQGPVHRRREALRLVEDGAPLKKIAARLDLPNWLRRLPPEAFRRPIQTLPDSQDFTRRISTRLPARPEMAAHWLETLAFAHAAANEDFALWLSAHHSSSRHLPPERVFAVLAAYAWHSSTHAADTNACNAQSAYIVVPWRSEMAFDTAICAAKSWWNRLRLVMQIGNDTIADSWLEQSHTQGFSVIPLTTQAEILAEAQDMQNCSDQYAERLAQDKCRLFSIRRGNKRIATMEIGQHPRETGVLTITQLKSKHNMPASLEIWQAAYAWLASQPGIRRLPPVIANAHPLDTTIWKQLMDPYRYRTGGAPWLPENPNDAAFSRLDYELSELARRAGVVSWLFT